MPVPVPLKVEEVAILGLVNRYVGLRSAIADEAVKVVDSPSFTHSTALFSLDFLVRCRLVAVDPVNRACTLTPAGVSALYENVERMQRLTQILETMKYGG